MTSKAHLSQYRNLMIALEAGSIDHQAFVDAYFKLWRTDRDLERNIMEQCGRIDLDLIERLTTSLISNDEFAEAWRIAWKTDLQHEQIAGVLDRCFTACQAYNMNPITREPYEIDENQLVHEVHDLRLELDHLLHLS